MPEIEYLTCKNCGKDFIPPEGTHQGLCPECELERIKEGDA